MQCNATKMQCKSRLSKLLSLVQKQLQKYNIRDRKLHFVLKYHKISNLFSKKKPNCESIVAKELLEFLQNSRKNSRFKQNKKLELPGIGPICKPKDDCENKN